MIVKDFDSFMTCGAVLAQMPKSEKHIYQYHAMLGFPVNHIVPISKSKQAIIFICLSQTDCRCMHVYILY